MSDNEKLRLDISVRILQGMLSGTFGTTGTDTPEFIRESVALSITIADELLKQVKESKSTYLR